MAIVRYLACFPFTNRITDPFYCFSNGGIREQREKAITPFRLVMCRVRELKAIRLLCCNDKDTLSELRDTVLRSKHNSPFWHIIHFLKLRNE